MATTRVAETEVRPSSRPRNVAVVVVVLTVILLGWFARSVAVDGSGSVALQWLPWMQRAPVNLYFGHPSEPALVPISRAMVTSDDTPTAIVNALLAGPPEGSGLIPLIPQGITLSRATLDDGVMTVDLAGPSEAFDDEVVVRSLWLSISSWSAVHKVDISVNGSPIDVDAATASQMYFWDKVGRRLVAQTAIATNPRDVLDEYLGGSMHDDFIGLPTDIQVVSFRLDSRNGLLSLDFTFEDSLRDLALDEPEGMRRVLEGLIATMTVTFPEVDGVYLDFGGQPVLGLGHCADLLRSLQLTPKPLNDERLLVRSNA